MTEQGSLATIRAQVVALYGASMHRPALAAAEEGLGSYPDDAWLHAVRADLLDTIGESALAVPAARHAISLSPEMGYGHRVLAEALMSTDAKRDAALEAADRAVQLDASVHAYYTLVRALVQHPRGARRAGEVARTLAQEHPQSVLAPLALALVALRRAGLFKAWRWWWVALVVVLTRGLFVVVLAGMWAVNAIRRVPHLRSADQHLRRALEMDPSSPTARLLAAEVLRARYRFGQAVDHQVAAGAMDARLITAADVVSPIARRIAVTVAAGYAIWTIPSFYLHREIHGEFTAPAVAATALVLIADMRRRQARALPPALRAALDRRALPLAAVAAAAAAVTSTSWCAHLHDTYYRAGSMVSAAIAVAGLFAAAVLFVRGRRAPC